MVELVYGTQYYFSNLWYTILFFEYKITLQNNYLSIIIFTLQDTHTDSSTKEHYTTRKLVTIGL